MTKEQQAAARARCEAATAGPWKAKLVPEYGKIRCHGISSAEWFNELTDSSIHNICETDSGYYPTTIADAEFIAHARADLPAALDHIATLEAALRSLPEWYDEMVCLLGCGGQPWETPPHAPDCPRITLSHLWDEP